jgi:hypothetical protein
MNFERWRMTKGYGDESGTSENQLRFLMMWATA